MEEIPIHLYYLPFISVGFTLFKLIFFLTVIAIALFGFVAIFLSDGPLPGGGSSFNAQDEYNKQKAITATNNMDILVKNLTVGGSGSIDKLLKK